MSNNRSVNISGNSHGSIITGDNSVINHYSSERDLSELAKIFKDLQKQFPNATESQKLVMTEASVAEAFKRSPALRERVIAALAEGAFELLNILSDNPFIRIPVALFKGWTAQK